MLVKDKVLSALEKDLRRRYVSSSTIQSDGRLELDAVAISILNPKDDEIFSAINDESSIIIVRNPLPHHKDKVIAQPQWDAKRKRLRLAQNALRILLTCKVGFRVFRYGEEIALEIEPFINAKEIPQELEDISELGPFVLRAPRSIYYIDIITNEQRFSHTDIKFRSLGEYWVRKFHQDPLDTSFKMVMCTGSGCVSCSSNLPIMKSVYWFPVLVYDGSYPRPGMISVRDSAFAIANTLMEICDNHRLENKDNADVKIYYKDGITSYDGKELFAVKTDSGDNIKITLDGRDDGFTTDEKGLMKLALKELEDLVKLNTKL